MREIVRALPRPLDHDSKALTGSGMRQASSRRRCTGSPVVRLISNLGRHALQLGIRP